MAFTERTIQALKPQLRPYVVTETGVSADRRGLQIRVFPSGQKTWLFRYRFANCSSYLNIGSHPATSIADAHRLQGEARKWLSQGYDPKGRVGAARDDVFTVRQLAEEWRDRYLKRERKTWAETWRILEKDMLPALGSRPADSITARDVVNVTDSIIDRGAPIAANKAHEAIKQMFRFAVSRGALTASPCVAVSKPTREEATRTRILTDNEIRTFWRNLDRARMLPYTRTLLRLLLVTGQRPGEHALAEWSEFDLAAQIWHMPANHTKNGKPHDVPLSALALELLAQLDEQTGGQDFLFPSPRGRQPMRRHAISRAIRNNEALIRLAHFTPHDLRRTVRSGLARLGVNPVVAKKVINHTLDGMDAIYDRHDYAREKRAALERWADHLQAVIAGTRPKVVPLREHA